MDIERLKEHDLYVLRAVVSGLEEEQSIDPVIARQFEKVIDEAIARQSVASDEVQRAIELLREPSKCMDYYWLDAQMNDALNLAITALQAYQPKGETE